MGNSKKVRVVAYCDAPVCATGFGTVSHNVLKGLYDTGEYDITVLGINYWGHPHEFPYPDKPCIKIHPVGINQERDPYGRQYVADILKKWDYDILFTIQDSFILEFLKDVVPHVKNKNPNMKWINYFPVDGKPKREWVEAMAVSDYPVTYTEWGKKQCIEVCPEIADKLSVIYHGANPTHFYPLPKNETERFRRLYFGSLADKFIVTSVARNQQRKDIPRTMRAFKKFQEKCPNSLLYQHSAVQDQGWDLTRVAESLDLVVNKDVAFPNDFGPNQGFPREILNSIYNSSDVVVSTSVGEGWGLSCTESMACCKPFVGPSNTALTEIVADRGILVRSGWDDNAFTILPSDNEVLRPLTHVDDMVDALVLLYNNKEKRTELGLKGYKWVTSTLRWDRHIVPQWVRIFEDAVKSTIDGSKAGAVSVVEV